MSNFNRVFSLTEFRTWYKFLGTELWAQRLSKHGTVEICGNKMPNRCNRWFLLQILLLPQHVSGTIMPIIRSSRVLYKWLLPVVFDAVKMETVINKMYTCFGYQLNAQFLHSITIYMLHYNPRHISSSTMLIFRRSYYIITASVIVTLCKRLYSTPVESGLCRVCSQPAYYTAIFLYCATGRGSPKDSG